MEEKPFASYMDLLQEGGMEGVTMSSQETQMSSQGFTALLHDPELFPDIKSEELDFDLFGPSTSAYAYQQPEEPVSPVSTASIESMGMEGVDESLKTAFEASSKKGTLIPLLKEELRCKIQRRRLDAGLDLELPAKPAVSSRDGEVSAESKRRMEIRKQRNRAAAKRCRAKKHQHERMVKEQACAAEKEHYRLLKEIENNRREIMCLQAALHQHRCVMSHPPRISSPNL